MKTEKMITVLIILELLLDILLRGKISELSTTSRDANTIGAPISRNGIPFAGEKLPITDSAMTSIDIIRDDRVREIEVIWKFLDLIAGSISFLASIMNIRNVKIITPDSENGS
tara:strand:+ start:442 stop:780 length:339 start_codon:yes stop_codon:yes gene_type:complete